jgi:hypothetical protein
VTDAGTKLSFMDLVQQIKSGVRPEDILQPSGARATGPPLRRPVPAAQPAELPPASIVSAATPVSSAEENEHDPSAHLRVLTLHQLCARLRCDADAHTADLTARAL